MDEKLLNNGNGETERRLNGGGGDEGDAKEFGSHESSQGAKIARMPVERNAPYYNMNHKKRGMAVIFNHEIFNIYGLKPRTGTNVDSNNLHKVLQGLGFDVTVLKNLTSSEVHNYVQQIAEVDHTDHDCLLIAVLTHGNSGSLYAKDTYYKPDKLWSHFTGDKCPTLAGKPKIFFIQACQRDKVDRDIHLRSTETDGLPSFSSYKIPIHADFLIVFSTVPGYYSWRNTTRGSWFMQALCDQLRLKDANRDILTLLTFVSRRVALDFESSTPDITMHQQKQIPCITSMLTRLLVFGDKE